jgi:HTH-type transcriptional regulator / antitoxin HipB
MEELANIIIYHRKKSGLNRDELAHIAGVGKTFIYDLEHGKHTIKLDTLLKVANVLGISFQVSSPLMNKYREEKEERK